MNGPVVKHHCGVCDKAYDTPEAAAACYKSPRGRFQPGDIIWDGKSSGKVYRITYIDPIDSPALDGAGVSFVQELRRAANMIDQPKGGRWIIGSFWCRAELFPLSEAIELRDELNIRLSAARGFLSELEACHQRHGECEVTTP